MIMAPVSTIIDQPGLLFAKLKRQRALVLDKDDSTIPPRVSTMREEPALVYVIDDDLSVREGVADLLQSVGHTVHSFGSARDFLESRLADAPGCIVLDLRLPGPSGLEFQRKLIESNIELPIIFQPV
jgi:PleD family two-component response regulator